MALPFRAVNIDCNFDYAFERERLAAVGIALIEQKSGTEDEIIAACTAADAVILEGAKTPLTMRVIGALPRCRVLAKYAVGVDNIDLAAATSQGIVVANAADYCTEEVSDHAVALMLAAARRVVALDRHLRAGGWGGPMRAVPVRRFSRLTVGLIGLGRIARATARKLQGFGCRVLAADPYLPAGVSAGPNVERVSLDRLLAESDLVSVHIPLSAETRGLVGAQMFSVMKSTAVLVNTSRGPVVDQAALIEALQSQRIAGAALDVFETEPLAVESPLRTMEQVILTPHTAADSVDSLQHARETVVDSVAAVLRGYWPPFPVNVRVIPRSALRPWSEAPSF